MTDEELYIDDIVLAAKHQAKEEGKHHIIDASRFAPHIYEFQKENIRIQLQYFPNDAMQVDEVLDLFYEDMNILHQDTGRPEDDFYHQNTEFEASYLKQVARALLLYD